ncbi:putative aspartic peptidase domain superfamily [Helianthus annuus]|nr:putative aspartic peptidase domain superfamily [Helianthus annuus]
MSVLFVCFYSYCHFEHPNDCRFCFFFSIINSITGIFPEVSLNFAGGAAMILKPENYLVHGTPLIYRYT